MFLMFSTYWFDILMYGKPWILYHTFFHFTLSVWHKAFFIKLKGHPYTVIINSIHFLVRKQWWKKNLTPKYQRILFLIQSVIHVSTQLLYSGGFLGLLDFTCLKK